MSEWVTLAFVVTAVGFLLMTLAFAGAGRDLTGADGAVEALEICGFLTFLTAFVLTAMVQYGQLENSRDVQIAHAALAYATGKSTVHITLHIGDLHIKNFILSSYDCGLLLSR